MAEAPLEVSKEKKTPMTEDEKKTPMTEEEKKTPMTEEERLALCQKLDKDLDDFINSMERKKYTDGWSEDTWEEEMDKHPFFMKSTPDGEMSPLAEGLAKLKYDPEENTALELANNYKEDGNFNFKHKNYRLAILGYTEGIKQKCDDSEINASLYNNRAAAHWHLKNYRSALCDSEKALSYSPDHAKARLRAAKSAAEVAKYDICIQYCEKLLESQPTNTEILGLLNNSKTKRTMQQRDQRKSDRLDAKAEQQNNAIIKAIKDRKIRVWKCNNEDDIDLSKLDPNLPGSTDAIVHIKDDLLHWSILLLYPEYQMTDLIKGCPENVSLMSQLQQVFPAPWDKDDKYNCNTVNVYYEGRNNLPYIVDVNMNLGDVLVTEGYELKAGTPAFVVVPRGSQSEKRFLGCYR